MIKKSEAREVINLCAEVSHLAHDTVAEIDAQEHWDDGEMVRRYEDHAPDSATHPGYSMTTAALKRRSMDLTRALARLRKA